MSVRTLICLHSGRNHCAHVILCIIIKWYQPFVLTCNYVRELSNLNITDIRSSCAGLK